MKREFTKGLLGLASMLLLAGCVVVPTPTPYPTYTPYATYTPQPVLPLPLSKYDGTEISMMYPAGWEVEDEEPGKLSILAPLPCGFIYIRWEEWEYEIGETAEDRYSKERERVYQEILRYRGARPDFELVREYRLGDAPVFEFQYLDEEAACTAKEKIMAYIDVESRQYVVAFWNLRCICAAAESNKAGGFRSALFDTVMQSITFK